MNSDLVPAAIAASGGATLAAGIWIHERRTDEAMRASRVRLAVRFPMALGATSAATAVGGLSGLSEAIELVTEVAASEDGIRHFVWVPDSVYSSTVSVLSGTMPGLRLTRVAAVPTGRATLAVRLFIRTPTVLITDDPEGASRTLLAGFGALARGEQVVVRWALRPSRPRPIRESPSRTSEALRAWHRKTALSGFYANGLVLVRAAQMSRARALAEHVTSAIRSRHTNVGGQRLTFERGNRSLGSLPRTTRTSGWLNRTETLPLLGWPMGEAVPGVEVGAARELLVPRHVPRKGRRLFVGRDGGGERPVALSAEAARHHLAVLGPTGSGKSAVLARGVLGDLARGYGGVLIDPKADLAHDVLDRVPAADADRVIVLDPAASGSVPGLDLFGAGDADLRSDTILSVLRAISEGWGPRIDQYLRLGLRTVAELDSPVLSDWLRLYTDASLRRDAVARLDPIRQAEWRTFEALSPAEQYQHIAPAISRITTLLSRPALRAILNQPEPKLDIARLLHERKWLFVSLAPGTLGEPAAHLLGAIVTYLVWAAVEARVTLASERRHPVFLYFDELQSLSSLPIGLELFFERTRGLGCGVVVATQAVARLPEGIRQSLFGNVASLITFKAGSDEATRIARELPGLNAIDIVSLDRFEVAARIATAGLGSGTAIVTGHTEPLPPASGQADAIRTCSANIYGVDPREVEAELRRRTDGGGSGDDGSVGRSRRVQ